MEVHNELGSGFLESVYEEALIREARKRNIPFITQVNIPIYYKGEELTKKFIADFIAYEKILVELKCIPKLSVREEAQIINYLKATQLPVGLLVNFGTHKKLDWRRYVLTQGRVEKQEFANKNISDSSRPFAAKKKN